MFYTDCLAESGIAVEKTTGVRRTTYISQPSKRVSVVVASKNGITLERVQIETRLLKYELYMDDVLLNTFSTEKQARAMFKDFSAD